MTEDTRLRVVSPVLRLREELKAQLREEFQLPVLPLPRGTRVPVTIARVEKVDPSRHWAVAVGQEAVHLVRVEADAKRLVGKRVDLQQDAGVVRLQLCEQTPALER